MSGVVDVLVTLELNARATVLAAESLTVEVLAALLLKARVTVLATLSGVDDVLVTDDVKLRTVPVDTEKIAAVYRRWRL